MASRVIFIGCGSYSPPTPMHLRMFELAKEYFNEYYDHYEVVGGIVSPVHDSYGKKGLVSAKHRCAMVKIALQSSNWVRMSDWEAGQGQWSRTRSVLEYHQNYINNYINDYNGTVNEIIPGWLPSGLKSSREKVQLKLLCGADLLESFAVPGLWAEEDIESIIGNHGLVVISRSGANPEKFIFDSDLLTKYRKNITLITNWVPSEISSTVVRKLLGRGKTVKYLIDDHLIEYIKLHGLYNVNESKYILTPNRNELVMNKNFLNAQYMKNNKVNLANNNSDHSHLEIMDETDFSSESTIFSRPKAFCCGNESTNVKTILNRRPGQAVQVITDSPSTGKNDENNEVKPKKLKTTMYAAV